MAGDAAAATILDTGSVAFVGIDTQFGRLTRDGIVSDWASPKPFPGVTSAPIARAYASYTVNAGIFPYLQISLDDPFAALFVSAYLTSFNPVNVAPFYGLDTNYLGDPGSSQPLGAPSVFRIVVAPGSTIVIPINEINPGGGIGRSYALFVEGFLDTDFNDVPGGPGVPEPSTLVLIATGFLLQRGAARPRRGAAGSPR